MNGKGKKQKRGVTGKVLAAILTLVMMCSVIYAPSVMAAVQDENSAQIEAPVEKTEMDTLEDSGETDEIVETENPEYETLDELVDESKNVNDRIENIASGGDLEEDKPFVFVEKTFVGLEYSQIPKSTFVINVGGESRRISDAINKEEETTVYRWKVPVNGGTYTVSESGCEVENYNWSSEPELPMQVTTKAVEMGMGDFIVDNANNVPEFYVGDGSVFVGRLTDGSLYVFTQKSLSMSQRETVKDGIKRIHESTWDVNNIHFYSVEIQGEKGPLSFKGGTVTFDKNSQKVIFSQQNLWNKVAKTSYTISGKVDADVKITNIYTPKTVNVNISKKVTGNFGDQSKEFEFTVTHDGINEDFKLTHGSTHVIENVKKGSNIIIRENDADDYDKTITVKLGENVILPNEDGSYTIPIDAEQPIQIEVENYKNITIDTGVFLDSLPYVLILAVVAAAAVVFVIRRHRKLS